MQAEGQASHWALSWLYMVERQKLQLNQWSPAYALLTSCKPHGRLPRSPWKTVKESKLSTGLLRFLIRGPCLSWKKNWNKKKKKKNQNKTKKPHQNKWKHSHKMDDHYCPSHKLNSSSWKSPPKTTGWEETKSTWTASCLPFHKKDTIYYCLGRISPGSCAGMIQIANLLVDFTVLGLEVPQ